jgi:hypothetical protein
LPRVAWAGFLLCRLLQVFPQSSAVSGAFLDRVDLQLSHQACRDLCTLLPSKISTLPNERLLYSLACHAILTAERSLVQRPPSVGPPRCLRQPLKKRLPRPALLLRLVLPLRLMTICLANGTSAQRDAPQLRLYLYVFHLHSWLNNFPAFLAMPSRSSRRALANRLKGTYL